MTYYHGRHSRWSLALIHTAALKIRFVLSFYICPIIKYNPDLNYSFIIRRDVSCNTINRPHVHYYNFINVECVCSYCKYNGPVKQGFSECTVYKTFIFI